MLAIPCLACVCARLFQNLCVFDVLTHALFLFVIFSYLCVFDRRVEDCKQHINPLKYCKWNLSTISMIVNHSNPLILRRVMNGWNVTAVLGRVEGLRFRPFKGLMDCIFSPSKGWRIMYKPSTLPRISNTILRRVKGSHLQSFKGLMDCV